MCRMVAYQGVDISVDRLVFGGAHSLETQSYRPRELLSGHVNADGIGVVWYRDGDPIAFRDSRPVWQVPELEALLRANAAGMALAAVRNVTPGIAIDASGIPPVVRGGVAVVLNGYLEDVQGTFLRPAVETLSDRALGLLRGLSDTELLAVEIDDRRHRGENLADAIVSTAQRVLARGRDTSRTIQLNLAVADGDPRPRVAGGEPERIQLALRLPGLLPCALRTPAGVGAPDSGGPVGACSPQLPDRSTKRRRPDPGSLTSPRPAPPSPCPVPPPLPAPGRDPGP